MCGTCGCEENAMHDHDDGHTHDHEGAHTHSHGNDHGHDHSPHDDKRLKIERAVLAKNDGYASFNRGFFAGRGIFAVNLLSSPGSGKTTLLERAIGDLARDMAVSVIEGDLATDRDAARIRAAGAPVVQINTGAVCHLDAHTVGHALEDLAPARGSVLFIENVGNLVCPAMFDLGEHERIVLFAVTEGEDKPIKYPHMFARASLVLLTKVDLLPHLSFDVESALGFAREVNPRAEVLRVSARTGAGMTELYDWLRKRSEPVLGGVR
ncbi:MAG: hydrogenase nickel incorporation protein HypB [Polyangiaceae bacterium]|nr:hydrogenase nickel incorporation protein HypB [Polyangiaceae bacterium]